MSRDDISDLRAFIAVAREGSFTRAAVQLGVSQSALSHTLRALESRLGVRLLTRTTRSVAPTAAGQRLLNTAGPRFDEITSELAALRELRDLAAGTIRITTTDFAANLVLSPRLAPVMAQYPDIKIEISVDYGLSDIVSERFDIGVRWGDQVAKDMIAVRVTPDMRLAIVGSPQYLARRGSPEKPQDLLLHSCITLRLPTRGSIYAWELKKGKRELQVRVDGQLTCNGVYQMRDGALNGVGLAFLPEDIVRDDIKTGRLVWLLPEWSPTFEGLHIYYPTRREFSRALSVVVDALRVPVDPLDPAAE